MLGGAKPPISCQGRSEGPKSERGRVESGVGFLGMGSQPPPHAVMHQLVSQSGECLSSPSGVQAEPRQGVKRFSCTRGAR